MVNKSETAKLLAKMQLIDNRTVDRATVEAWHEAVGHNDFADAMSALDQHRRASTAWVEPAHINALVALMRQNRESLRNRARAIGAGPPRAIEAPPAWFNEGRPRTRPKPPGVPCPWCGATAHEPCTVRGYDRPLSGIHPARSEASADAGASSVEETQ